MNQQKDILFYGTHCQFSKDVLNYIVKKNIRGEFMLINVEKNINRIPHQVDRVPALLTQQDHTLYFEDDIVSYIDAVYNAKFGRDDNIEPVDQMNCGYSGQFSWLDDSQDATGPLQGFAPVGYEQRINTPDDDGGTNNKSSGSKEIDRFTSEREKDVSNIFGDRRTQ